MKIILILLAFVSCNLKPKPVIKLGAHWEQIEVKTPFIDRSDFGTLVIDNTILIIGGMRIDNIGVDEVLNDIWISSDLGTNWSQIKPTTTNPTDTFIKRQKFGIALIEKDIYIIGGYSTSSYFLNDVWVSKDLGKTWTEIIRNASWTPRYGHQAISIGDTLYIVGGYDSRNYYNEVWTSKDLGKTWSEIPNAFFKPREGMGVINYNDEFLLIGGKNKNEWLVDVWRTDDEKEWFRQQNVPFDFFEHSIVEVEKDLFVIEQDQVWKSIDEAQTWKKILFYAPFEERTGYGLVNVSNKLILFGGKKPNMKYLNDVWVSEYIILEIE